MPAQFNSNNKIARKLNSGFLAYIKIYSKLSALKLGKKDRSFATSSKFQLQQWERAHIVLVAALIFSFFSIFLYETTKQYII